MSMTIDDLLIVNERLRGNDAISLVVLGKKAEVDDEYVSLKHCNARSCGSYDRDKVYLQIWTCF